MCLPPLATTLTLPSDSANASADPGQSEPPPKQVPGSPWRSLRPARQQATARPEERGEMAWVWLWRRHVTEDSSWKRDAETCPETDVASLVKSLTEPRNGCDSLPMVSFRLLSPATNGLLTALLLPRSTNGGATSHLSRVWHRMPACLFGLSQH